MPTERQFPTSRRRILRSLAAGVGAIGAGATEASGSNRATEVERETVRGAAKCREYGRGRGLKVEGFGRRPCGCEGHTVRKFNFEVDGRERWLTMSIYHDDEGEPVSIRVGSNCDFDAILVKGGPNTNVYRGPRLNDDWKTAFETPHNPNSGEPYGLSYVEFCCGSSERKRDDDDDDTEDEKEDDDRENGKEKDAGKGGDDDRGKGDDDDRKEKDDDRDDDKDDDDKNDGDDDEDDGDDDDDDD